MSAVNHNHYVTAQRGGAFMSGSSAAGGNLTSQKIDTPEYSHHNLSHTIRTTAQCGELYPIDTITCVPADKMKLDANLTSLFLPTNKPFLDEFEQTLHTYYCPTRLLDPTFEFFLTGGKDGTYNRERPAFDLVQFGKQINNIGTVTVDGNISNIDLKKATDYGSPFDLFNLPCGHKDDSIGTDALAGVAMDGIDDKIICPTLYDKFMMMQRVYNEYYRIPEYETDLFLNIPVTPEETVRTFYEHLIQVCVDSMGHITKPQLFNEAYKFIQANDGVFWRVWEWLSKRPTSLTVRNSTGYTYFGAGAGKQYTSLFTDATLTFNWSADYARSPYSTTAPLSKYVHWADLVSGENFLWYDDERPSTISGVVSGSFTGKSFVAEPTGYHVWFTDSTSTDAISADYIMTCIILAWQLSCFKPHSMCYERDKFNIALPYTQRGVAAKIAANIYTNGTSMNTLTKSSNTYAADAALTYGDNYGGDDSGNPLYRILNGTSSLQAVFNQNDLRNLRAETRFLEKAAKFGYRYDEYLRGIFGVTSDATALERAMYIGGIKSGLNSTRVTNMSGTPDSDNNVQIGQWSGEAGTNANGYIGEWTCAEHGYIMSFYCMKPRLSYRNINDPENHKFVDRTQLFTPDFAYIQEQPITADELMSSSCAQFAYQVNGMTDSSITPHWYGNVPRYNEYRQIPSVTHGQLADAHTADFECFTVARKVSTVNPYNDFVSFNHVRPDDESVARIFQVDPTSVPPIIIELGFGVDAVREIPAFTSTL